MTSYGQGWDDVNRTKQPLISEGLVDVKDDVLAQLFEDKNSEHFMRAGAVMVEIAARLTLGLNVEADKDREREGGQGQEVGKRAFGEELPTGRDGS